MVAIELLAGLIYCVGVWRIWEANWPSQRLLIVVILVTGGLMRLALLPSRPILEDDFYRYLWDGGVVAAGHNPYATAPEDVSDARSGSGDGHAELRELAEASGLVHERINYPHLRTIYPPLAQAVFALAHRIDPWGLFGWRLVILLTELMTLALLAGLLKEAGLPLGCLAIYWWNPLVAKELVNSAHMDALVLPLVLAGLLCAVRHRWLLASALVGMGAGVKLWPVILLPLFLRNLLRRPRRLAASVLVFALTALIILGPFTLVATGPDSGLVAYGQKWEMNDALFMTLSWGVLPLARLAGGTAETARLVTRVMVGMLLFGWVVWLAFRENGKPSDLYEKCLLAVAALFLLSPTQFPWYAVWFIPFLALRPRPSLLLLSVLLFLYYLRFYFAGIERTALFDYGIVYLEFLPVWGLLIWEWMRSRPPYPLDHRARTP